MQPTHDAFRLNSKGLTLIEVLVAVGLGAVVMGMAFGMLRFSRISTEQTLGPQMGLQMASRGALIQLVKELQESIEFLRPKQGSSLTYFLARDKLNRILTGYIAKDDAASLTAGRDLHTLYLHRRTPGGGTPADTQRKILSDIERATFTALSSGVLQIHLTLHEQGKSYTMLTTVRARNVLLEGEL